MRKEGSVHPQVSINSLAIIPLATCPPSNSRDHGVILRVGDLHHDSNSIAANHLNKALASASRPCRGEYFGTGMACGWCMIEVIRRHTEARIGRQ